MNFLTFLEREGWRGMGFEFVVLSCLSYDISFLINLLTVYVL